MHGTANRPAETRDPESGNTLVVALLILFLLTSLGISYVAVTKGDKQIAGNQLTSGQAFEHAEAGISEVLGRTSNPQASYYLGEPAGTVTPGWGRYVVNDPGNGGLDPAYEATASDGLDNDGDAAVDEASEHYPETGSRQFSLPLADRLDYPWVKARYKLNGANQVVRFGDHDNDPTTPPRENLLRGAPVLIVTSAGRRGIGAKAVTVQAIKWPVPPVPGSVYTEGPLTFSGAAFNVDGHDHDYTAPYDTVTGATSLPGISTTGDPNAIKSGLVPQQADNIDGAGGTPSVSSASVDLDLPALAAGWSQLADITLIGDQNNPSTAGWGTVTNLKVVHVTGDLALSGTATGSGVLVIDGDFQLGGTFNWNGVVICLGDLRVVGGGNAKNIVGGLLIQGTATGNSVITGNVKVLYSSAMISQLSQLKRYEVSSWIDQ